MHGIAIESQLSKHAAIGLVQDSALSSSEFVCVCVSVRLCALVCAAGPCTRACAWGGGFPKLRSFVLVPHFMVVFLASSPLTLVLSIREGGGCWIANVCLFVLVRCY